MGELSCCTIVQLCTAAVEYDTWHISLLSTAVAVLVERCCSIRLERHRCSKSHLIASMVLSNASMDGVSALSELHTQRLLSESQVDLLKAHLLRNGAVAQDFWANTKRLHEFRASGILSEEECAEQIQKHVTEVLTPASARERPAAAVESATPSASRGPSTQPKKAAKPSTQRERARERAAANVLGGNIVNAFAIANRVSCHKMCSSPPAGWQLITVQYCTDNVYYSRGGIGGHF